MRLCKRVRKSMKRKKFTFADMAKLAGVGRGGESRERLRELESRNHTLR